MKTIGVRELKFSGFSYLSDKIKWLKFNKNMKELSWRLLVSWYGIALHLDQKNNFLRVFQARLDHMCFISESKNLSLRILSWQCQFFLTLMAQACRAWQKWIKSHKNATMTDSNTQNPPQEKLQMVQGLIKAVFNIGILILGTLIWAYPNLIFK